MELLIATRLEKLDKENLISIILTLQQQIQQLQETVAEQGAELQSLRDQVTKNSQNSGKPPSSDGLKSRETCVKRRVVSRVGRKIIPAIPSRWVQQPDHVEVHAVATCGHCSTDLRSIEPCGHERRQVFDIPPVRRK